jgi:hypothetical protein
MDGYSAQTPTGAAGADGYSAISGTGSQNTSLSRASGGRSTSGAYSRVSAMKNQIKQREMIAKLEEAKKAERGKL